MVILGTIYSANGRLARHTPVGNSSVMWTVRDLRHAEDRRDAI
jgi:hypothetical protein